MQQTALKQIMGRLPVTKGELEEYTNKIEELKKIIDLETSFIHETYKKTDGLLVELHMLNNEFRKINPASKEFVSQIEFSMQQRINRIENNVRELQSSMSYVKTQCNIIKPI